MGTGRGWNRVTMSGLAIAAPLWLAWLSVSGCASLQEELGARPGASTVVSPPATASMPMTQARPTGGQPVPLSPPPMAPAGSAGGMGESPSGSGVISAPRPAGTPPYSAPPPAQSAPPPVATPYPVAPAVQERPSSSSHTDPARGYGVPAATVPATDPGLLPIPAYQPAALSGGYASPAAGPSWPDDGSNQLYRMNPAAAGGAQPAMGGGPSWPNDGSNQLNRVGGNAGAPAHGPTPTGGGASWPNDGSNQLGRMAPTAPVQAAMQAAAPHLPVSVVGQVPPAAVQAAAPAHGPAESHGGGSGAGAEHGSAAIHWSYDGAAGPQFWGELQPDYKLCKQGRNQSPVDIPAGLNVESFQILFQYRPIPLAVLNNGHTLQIANPTDARLMVGGEEFQLAQLHFHAPSEHTVQGRSFPLEMHLVHKNSAGMLAVVGVLFEEGPENPILERIWQVAPRGAGQTQDVPGVAIDLDSMLSLDKGFVRYSGSLTTPPCTEGVRWFVLNQPNYLSPQQARAFEAINGKNARPVQYLMGRKVVRNQ